MYINLKIVTRRSMAVIIISALLLIFFGCENSPTEVKDYRPEASLYAYLTNGQPLNAIYLERISSLYGYYEPRGIPNADVKVYPLHTAAGDTFRFRQHTHPDSSYLYIPDGDTLIPQGRTRYKIEVYCADGDYLWSEALVPGEFDSLFVVDTLFINPAANSDFSLDTMSWANDEIALYWSTVDSAGGYFGVVKCLTPLSELEPLDKDWDIEEDPIDTTETDRTGWTLMRDDQQFVTVPWIAFQWVGHYEIQMLAVTREYYEYAFSLFRVGGGLGNRPQFNIRGGLGMFAGITRFSFHVYMKRVD